jgi:hypothetical protein
MKDWPSLILPDRYGTALLPPARAPLPNPIGNRGSAGSQALRVKMYKCKCNLCRGFAVYNGVGYGRPL